MQEFVEYWPLLWPQKILAPPPYFGLAGGEKVIQLDSNSFGARFTTVNNNQLLQELGVPSVLVSVNDDIEQMLRPDYYPQSMDLVNS